MTRASSSGEPAGPAEQEPVPLDSRRFGHLPERAVYRNKPKMPQAAGPASPAEPAACGLVIAGRGGPAAGAAACDQCGSAAGIAPSEDRLSAGAGLIAAGAPAVCARARSSSSRRRDGSSRTATTAPTPNSTADTANATV